MQLLNDSQLDFVPGIVKNRSGSSFIESHGWVWEVLTWKEGEADLSDRVAVQRRSSAAEAVAQVHHHWQKDEVHRQVSPGLLVRIERLRRYEARLPELVLHSQSLGSAASKQVGENHYWSLGEMLDLSRRTLAHLSLDSTRLLATLNRLCHPVEVHYAVRDLHNEHVLYQENLVTGIIDFGAARLDEPLLDLVRLLGTQSPYDPQARYESLDFYCNARKELSPSYVEPDRDILFERFSALDHASTLLSALQWLDWLLIKQRKFAIPYCQTLPRWIRLLNRLDQSQW